MPNVAFNTDNTVNRKFTPEWNESGIIRQEKIPAMIAALVASKNEMVEYIEQLHDCIDEQSKHIEVLEQKLGIPRTK